VVLRQLQNRTHSQLYEAVFLVNCKRCICPVPITHFVSAAFTVDSSHVTASSSTLWSRFSPPSNFVNGHMLKMWFMVCRWPQSQEDDWGKTPFVQVSNRHQTAWQIMSKRIPSVVNCLCSEILSRHQIITTYMRHEIPGIFKQFTWAMKSDPSSNQPITSNYLSLSLSSTLSSYGDRTFAAVKLSSSPAA